MHSLVRGLVSALFTLALAGAQTILSPIQAQAAIADPSGPCSNYGSLIYNILDGKLFGCQSPGTYVQIGGGSTPTLPLSIANGGTGTASPTITPGANVTISGTWPNYTISSASAGSSFNQTLENNSTPVTQRAKFNFVAGSNVTTAWSDNGSDTSTLTISAAGGGGGGASSSAQLSDFGTTDTTTAITVAAGLYGAGNATSYSLAQTVFTAQRYSITGCTNAAPIVCTLSSVSGIHNGDSIMVAGVGGNTAANGTWAVTIAGSTITLVGSTGNAAYTSGGTAGGTGNGMAYVEASAAGALTLYHSAAAGMIFTCSGAACVTDQVTTPAFDDCPASAISTVAITAGALGTVTDKRAFLRNCGVSAGLGISVTPAGGVASIAVDASVARLSASQAFSGANSFSSLQHVPAAFATLPTCNAGAEGSVFAVTDSSTNTWGATVTGGSTNHVLAYCDASNWTVAAK